MSMSLNDTDAMLALLEAWTQRSWIREVDLALVRFFQSESPAMPAPLMLASALVSHQLGRGHVCLNLDITIQDPYMALSLPPESDMAPGGDVIVQPKDLLATLNASAWAESLRYPDLVGVGEGNTPLVLDGHRLYLRRYWRYERQLEAAINARMAKSQQIADELPVEVFRRTLDALFPEQLDEKTDWQKVACALSARSAFSIITGGPGTGKTTTVVRLLALLQSIALGVNQKRPLEIRLAAPTGKAAARLKESITNAIEKLPELVSRDEALKASIPCEVTTLHRLLGTRPGSRFFRHDARNPLPIDVLVIDEGSMVDLEMMAATLNALPYSARIILLGDKDQLASVEAGSVLGELCRRAEEGHFSVTTADWIKLATGQQIDSKLLDTDGWPLDQHIVMLRESRRFDADSGIGQLARAINAGKPEHVRKVWDHGYPDLKQIGLMSLDQESFESLMIGPQGASDGPQGLGRYLRVIEKECPPLNADKVAFDHWAAKVLVAFSKFQLLCALRSGPYGVSGINLRIESLLRRANLIRQSGAWYEGRPVLITRNDYQLGLMNGDIGITLPYPQLNKHTGELSWGIRVAFTKGDDTGIQWVLPSRLSSTETVFALTVHKSQGSEFEHCALLLPPERNPVLTRELVYTGITRAKCWFTLLTTGKREILQEAIVRTVQRSGGLFNKG